MKPKSRKLYKVTVGYSQSTTAGYCYVLANSIREAIVKARKEFKYLDKDTNHVVSVEELNDRVVE